LTDAWWQYQEEAASFFRSLGFETHIDVTIAGVRTKHDIDVLVRWRHAGFDVTWIVECKHWQASVSKLHVLALREIVQDIGADRGILLTEAGFQRGAHEAATFTNVRLSSLADLRTQTRNELCAMRTASLLERLEQCHYRYWELPKDFRIENGLRLDGPSNYSSDLAMRISKDILREAKWGTFPIDMGPTLPTMFPKLSKKINNLEDAVEVVDAIVLELEGKLDDAYAAYPHWKAQNQGQA
jgi:hypothetical protein